MSCTPSIPEYALTGEDRVNNTITTRIKPTLSLSHKAEAGYIFMNKAGVMAWVSIATPVAGMAMGQRDPVGTQALILPAHASFIAVAKHATQLCAVGAWFGDDPG